jgi:RHS repeat-associated protein
LEKFLFKERNNSWNTPYLFNSKELDEETGLYYYGARYYNPRESVWLSADPIAEKYPNVSPYAYTFQNPVRYTDPTGMEGVGAQSDPPPGAPFSHGTIWKDSDGKWAWDSKNRIWQGLEGSKDIGNTSFSKSIFGNSETNSITSVHAVQVGASYEGTYGSISGNAKTLTAVYTNNTGDGAAPLAVDISGKASTLSAQADARLGTVNYNVFGGAKGDLMSANANVSAGIFTGEGGKKGLLLDDNIGAKVLSGDVSFGGTLFGISLKGTAGATAVSAHAGAGINFYYDTKEGALNIKIHQNLGLGFGEKFSLDVNIPVPHRRLNY